MTKAKIAVQTIVWGNERVGEDPISVFEEALGAGYEGVECRNTVAGNEGLRDYLDQSPLSIAAFHANLQAMGPASGELSWLLDRMEQLGVQRLLFSSRPEILNQQEHGVRLFASISEQCADRNVRALYHNHGREFEAGLGLLDRLAGVEGAGLALDVGWAHRAGQDVTRLVERYGDRIGYVHLKDTLPDTWMELGRGEVDLERVIREISALELPWWTVEQDDTERDPSESAAMSRSYLRELGF